jgi:prepilin-type N-terminal cleavage/methylation domain-containing protein
MHKVDKKLRSRKGFSLLEIIIVVAIIVILAGVIGVGVSGLINTANNANNAVANSSAQVDQQIQDQEDELRGFSFAN